MCRLAGYVGHQPIALSALLYDPPHSLEKAAYAPQELLSGTVNVDGTGVAWWEEGATAPLRYVSTQPPWSDPNLPGLAPALNGTTIVGAVRSATPGLPFGPANVAPFVVDNVAGVHNGWIGGFRQGVGRHLLAELDDERFGKLDAMNDSLALVLLVAQFRADTPNSDLQDAVAATIQRTVKVVVAAERRATLNLAVAAAGEIVVARTSVATDVNSLYTLVDNTGNWVASEPLDQEADWRAVPDHSLVRLTKAGVELRPIDHEGMSQ